MKTAVVTVDWAKERCCWTFFNDDDGMAASAFRDSIASDFPGASTVVVRNEAAKTAWLKRLFPDEVSDE